MEFGVALLSAAASAAVSSAMPKLGRAIANLAGNPKTEATSIKYDLLFIQYAIRENSFAGCPPLSKLVCRMLTELSYEIEDCLDCFEAKKTSAEEFVAELARLKTRSKETREQILDYTKIIEDMKKSRGTSSAQAQWQQVAPAAASEVPVPKELQGLVDMGGIDKLHCLLYFCMFPHEHPARRNPLIRRWLAEGLVVGGEDDAAKYLKALIDGKIINTTEKSNNGKAKTCQPPVEILKFINQESSSTNFIQFCRHMNRIEPDSARRLSLHPNSETVDEMNWPDFPHLHTLAAFNSRYELRFHKYKVLRVLDLKEFDALSKQQILAICKLLLLKYLSFRCGTDELPSEIGKLAWLETLDMRGSQTVTVHKEVFMMLRLKHLLGKFELSKMDACLTFRNWENTELGKFLKKKSVLQTLSGFVSSGRHGFPELMSLMRKLMKVKIWCKSKGSEANLPAISGAITKFVGDGIQYQGRSLSIDFHECPQQFLNDVQVRKGNCTTSLKLNGKLNRFPQFVARLSGLEELCLSSTALLWSVILAELSNLGALKYLKLVEDNLGRVEILKEELRSLNRLCLVCQPNLDIAIQAGALPYLVSLHLICQNLEVVAGNPGMEIKHMEALEEIGLHPKVSPGMKEAWEIDAEVHPNKPRVDYFCP